MTQQLAIVCTTILAGLWLVTRSQERRDVSRADERQASSDLTHAIRTMAAAAAALDRAAPDRAPSRVGDRVTVHTKQPDDQTIFGLVVGDHDDKLILDAAEYVAVTGNMPLPGRQEIDRDDIAWLDLHAPAQAASSPTSA